MALALTSGPATSHGTRTQELRRACSRLLDVIRGTHALFEIRAELGEAENLSSGRKFDFHVVRIYVGSRTYLLEEGAAVARLDSLRISIPRNGRTNLDIILNPEHERRLVTYLRWGRPPGEAPFDCGSFALHMNGLPTPQCTLFNHEWVISPLEEEVLRTGATVVLYDQRGDPTHAAIYLGSGLYLSKFGPSGSLIVTTLAQMKVGFDAEHAKILRRPDEDK